MIGKRIAIIGTSGSGKSTLSRQLAQLLSVPQIELDALHWLPNWTSMPDDELNRVLAKKLDENDGWTCDGNYSVVRDTLWSRADTIIWLDYPKWFVMQRILRRTIKRGITREKLWADNQENLLNLFKSNDENVVLWAWNTHAKHRERYPKLFQDPRFAHLRVIHLTHPQQTQAFLAQLSLMRPDAR
jgi:adenylate kinase family enzyme